MSRIIGYANGLPVYTTEPDLETRAVAHDPATGQFTSSGSGGVGGSSKSKGRHLIDTAHSASAKAHKENTRESHEAAQKAHEAVVGHFKKHGDTLDKASKHESKAVEHKLLAEAHGSEGAAKLSKLAYAAGVHAKIHRTKEAYTAEQKAHEAAREAHGADTDEGGRHKMFAGLAAITPTPKPNHAADHADKLSAEAKTPAEHIAAAKAHYTSTLDPHKATSIRDIERYSEHAIKAHEDLEKLEKYPPNENGHPIHPASWAEHHYGEHIANLPDKQREAIAAYAGTEAFKTANSNLRRGRTPKLAKDMDAALASKRTPEALTVNRTMLKMPPGIEVGKQFTDPGYMSTTIHHSGTQFGPTAPIYMDIHVPAGSHGLPIRAISKHKAEEEFLLPRGTKLQIDHIGQHEGRTHIKATVVHE